MNEREEMGIPSMPLPSETVELELNTYSIIEMIEKQLEGYQYNPREKAYFRIGDPLVNQKGIRKIGAVLGSYISRDKILSTMDLDDIKETTKEISEAVSILLLLNYRDFEIRKSDLDIVMKIIEHSIEANLRRSLGGRTLDHIQNMVKIQEREEKQGGTLPGMSMLGGNK